MKLSLTPSLGFAAAASPGTEPSTAVRATRPKRVSPISSKAVRPLTANPVEAPSTESE